MDDLRLYNAIDVTIEDEMQSSYLDYAMSVIVSRAIPDVRDGLKPVHRRILYAMYENRYDYNKPYRKSARIVGDVIGKYHPHSDVAIYDSLVRMAQDFSLRVPLIDGQGNFGSIDGDAPAAMRYTESRMQAITHYMLQDIDKETVEFQDNYDGTAQEPRVLPSRFPNLLVNGSGGIAVGMATNIPTFNLGEIIDACLAYIDNRDIEGDELVRLVPGPDFPTGAIILGRNGSYNTVTTGRGSVLIRAKTHFENLDSNKNTAIVVTEIPYQVNKAKMIEKIAELVKDKKIEGISDLRDESNKKGIRVVIELKKNTNHDVVLNLLFKYSNLQTSFSSNMLALDNYGIPKVMSVKDIIKCFIEFREQVITNRVKYLLRKSRERAHVFIGLAIAVANIEQVIKMIRSSKDSAEAKVRLMSTSWVAEDIIALIKLVADTGNKVVDGRCYFTEEQAKAVLDMRLAKLTGLEKEKIDEELSVLAKNIEEHLAILSIRDNLIQVMKDELIEIKDKYSTPRLSSFEDNEFEEDIESLIEQENVVVTVTMQGYIKRVSLDTYRAQSRGGKGRSGMNMSDDDVTLKLYVASSHSSMLFFSNFGKVYKLKVYKLPVGSPTSKGRSMVNIFPIQTGEKITNTMIMPDKEDDLKDMNMIFALSNGNVRRSDMSDFSLVQSNGKIAIGLPVGVDLIDVKPAKNSEHIFLASYLGKCIRFPVDSLRVIKSRSSSGVQGMNLVKGDFINSMDVIAGINSSVEERADFLRIPVEQRRMIKQYLVSDEEGDTLLGSRDDSIKNAIGDNIELNFDRVVDLVNKEEFLLTITQNGYGKISSLYEYRITNRGGKGIQNIITSARNGNVVSSFTVCAGEQIILITDHGKVIRCNVDDIRVIGRNSQGVIIFRVAEGEKVVSASLIASKEEE